MPCEPPLPAPIERRDGRAGPVVLSVPHSGRDCPEAFASLVRGGGRAIAALADPFVDRLVAPLIEEGFAAVVAQAPRAIIDVNRPLDALDPSLHPFAPPPPPGSKAALGLGLVIARASDGGALWEMPIERAALEARIEHGWRPYHGAIERRVGSARRRHGTAILIDCHSMPPRARGLPRVVLGTRDGASIDRVHAAAAAEAVRRLGIEVAMDRPYRGGEIIARHGDPARGVQALQVEIDRSLYLDRSLRAPGPGMGRGAAIFRAIARTLERLADETAARAAE